MRKPRVLTFDIETTLLRSYHFQLGKQFMNHKALVEGHDRYGIICIGYCINGGAPKLLSCDFESGDDTKLIEDFDEVVKSCDIVLGKNSRRFDIKHINTIRMFNGVAPLPGWATINEDIESQMRKYFFLPSYSLDYISKQLGLGGKDVMCFDDWKDISKGMEAHKLINRIGKPEVAKISKVLYKEAIGTILSKYKKAFKKMCVYCKKDVADTYALYKHLEDHIQPRLNVARFLGHEDGNYSRCTKCGGTDITKNGKDKRGATVKQKFYCKTCKSECGKASILKNGKFGKMEYL